MQFRQFRFGKIRMMDEKKSKLLGQIMVYKFFIQQIISQSELIINSNQLNFWG